MTTSSKSTRTEELAAVHDTLDKPLLSQAQQTLEQCAPSDASPDTIEETLATLDFELLEQAIRNLGDALSVVHDPVLKQKNRFIDSIEVARENLSLLVTPFFEEYAPADALTEKQAKRFVVETYDANKLTRQAGAANTAARELNNILLAKPETGTTTTSNKPPDQNIFSRIKTTASAFLSRFTYTTPNSDTDPK